MKIYIVNPPYFPHFGRGARWQDTGRAGTLYYPVWLSYAAAILEPDHDLRFVDAPAWNWNLENVIKDLKEFKPEMVIVDSSFPSLKNDLSVSKAMREAIPSAIFVMVGPTGALRSKDILESGVIDIVTRFEYDFTLKELSSVLEDKGDISQVLGISYIKDGVIYNNGDRPFSTSDMLDTVPFVAPIYKKYLNPKDYFLGSSLYPEVQIFTGRGCPNLCTFCSWPKTLTGMCYRTRKISSVLDEVEWIEKNMDVNEIFFEDDTFTINKNRVMEFCEGYLKRDLKVAWACNARANTLDLETMKMMKKAHCRLLITGFESGSAEILKSIRKNITLEQARTFANNAKKAGLLLQGDFIVGLQGETKETIEETKKLIWELRPDLLQVSVASPFPGTEFYEWCDANGYLLTNNPDEYLDNEGHQKAIISYPGLSNEEMVSEVSCILKSYYVSIKYVPLAIRQVLRRNGWYEFKRILFSARMFLSR